MASTMDQFVCAKCADHLYTKRTSVNRHIKTHHNGDRISCLQIPAARVNEVKTIILQQGLLQLPLPSSLASDVVVLTPTPVPAAATAPANTISAAPLPPPPPQTTAAVAPAAVPAPGSSLGPAPALTPAPAPVPGLRTPSSESPSLRSSRSTRNQEHQVASRNRGAVDLDPTEGLPVQKWEKVSVRINQDPSADPSATTNQSAASATSSAEWVAQFNTPQFPWPEPPLPSFFNQLPTWNQEMIRRARAGNTNVKPSVWDNKAGGWLSSAEGEKRQNPLKSVHLNNLDHTSTNNNIIPDDTAQNDEDEDNDDVDDDGMADDNEDDTVGPTRDTPGPKRRKHTAPEDRAFEVKRWQQVPLAVAEKIEERKFLADRRPGMPSLYGGAYQAQIFSSMGLTQNGYNGNGISSTSYDLGDGSGLGSAIGTNGNDQGTATPVRRNMPPKRKKKKGGPGRRKANQTQTDGAGSSVQANSGISGQNSQDITQQDINKDRKENGDTTMQDGDVDGDGSGSDESEGEGSEEGEIDEGKAEESTQAPAPAPAPTQEQEPVVTANVEVSVPVPVPVPASIPEILISDDVVEAKVAEPVIEADAPEPVSEQPELVPESTPAQSEPPPSAAATITTATEVPVVPVVDAGMPEIDLLGGLEDQLDRDMQE